MAKFVGLSPQEIYTFACEEYHLKRNSRLFNELPSTAAGVNTVTMIDVSNNYIGPKGLKGLLQVVRSCPALHTLVLRDQQLTKDSVLTLCDALVSHPALRILDLRQNPITIDGGRHIYDLVCSNARIEEVRLDGTDVKDSLMTAIATKAARNKQHMARLESITGAAGSPASTKRARGGGDDSTQQAAGSGNGGGAVAALRSIVSGGGHQEDLVASLSDATLDASLAREIMQRAPCSVHSVLLDEDMQASLTERCEATRCHFLDPDFGNAEALSPVSSELPARVKGWKRIVHFAGNPCIFTGLTAAHLERAQSLTERQQQQQQSAAGAGAGSTGGGGAAEEAPQQLPAPREPTNVAPEFTWIFTSLFAILHGSDLTSSLQSLISPPVLNPAGVYCVKFFVDGRWRWVLVDDYLPVGADGNPVLCGTEGSLAPSSSGAAAPVPVAAQLPPGSNAFWPALLLKAAAKLHGSYRALMSTHLAAPNRHPTFERAASAGTIMSDFSGGVSVTRQLNHAHFDAAAWWQTMSELHEQKAWLVATTGADTEATSSGGIMPFHAYRIRQCRTVNGNLLVQLHSVHSRRVWIGEWGHSSPLWESNADVAAALAYRPSSTRGPFAPFWMRYSAFLSCFTHVHACCPCLQSHTAMVEGAFVSSTAGGPAFEPTTWWSNPHYRLRLSRSAKVLLALSVPDVRFHSSSITTMGLHILRGEDYPLRCEKESLFATTNYAVCNCVTYSAELPGDGALWVVPSTYDEGVYGRYFLRVVASETFSFAHESRDQHLKTYSIRCGMADTGEYQHGECNPQFAIQTLPDAGSAAMASAAVADPHVASQNTCRIAVQMHVPDTENANVGLLLCHSIQHGGEEASSSAVEGRLTAAGGGGISIDPKTGERTVDRLLGPIADDRVVARSKLIIGKTVFLDAHVPVTSDPYLLVPCVLPHHTFNVPISLTVWCSAPSTKISEIPMWPSAEVGVEWTRSGGLQDVAQNPQVELVVRRPQQRFLIHLEVFGVADPSLILYVVRQAQGHETIALPPGHRVADSSIVSNSQFVRHCTTTCEVTLPGSNSSMNDPRGAQLPAHFIILPCLQPPGTSARGTVRVSSEFDDFDVSLLPINSHDG